MIFISGKAFNFTNSLSEKFDSYCVMLILYITFPHILIKGVKYFGFHCTPTFNNYVGINLKLLYH